MKYLFYTILLFQNFLFSNEKHKDCHICGRRYDVQNVQTVSGKITQVDSLKSIHQDQPPGTQLVLKIKKHSLYVHLAPDWYLERQEMQFKVGDQIEVTGSKVERDGEIILLVQSVRKGNQQMILRDENGMPYWNAVRHL